MKCTIHCAVVDRPNARPNFFAKQRTTKGHCDRVCFAVKYHVNAVKKIPGIRAGCFRLTEARKLLYLAAAELNAPLSLCSAKESRCKGVVMRGLKGATRSIADISHEKRSHRAAAAAKALFAHNAQGPILVISLPIYREGFSRFSPRDLRVASLPTKKELCLPNG